MDRRGMSAVLTFAALISLLLPAGCARHADFVEVRDEHYRVAIGSGFDGEIPLCVGLCLCSRSCRQCRDYLRADVVLMTGDAIDVGEFL